MISLGLTGAQLDRLRKLLVTNHSIRAEVQLMTLSHKYEGDVTKHLLGGQVNFDAGASEATRSCNLELLDPKHQLQLDSAAPTDGSLYGSKMVKVIIYVTSIDNRFTVPIPIFTGPLTGVSRSGPVLSVEAMGKEVLSLSSVWKGRTFKKGMKKTEVLRLIMTEIAGEANNKLDFVNSNQKTPKKISLDREDTPWTVAKSIARSMGLQLFYDGRGVLRLRPQPNKTVYTFDTSALMDDPQAKYDMEEVVNAVEVIGGVPKGQKKKITYRVVADSSHPLSPAKLGRNGTPRYLPETLEDDSIRNVKDARAVATKRLKRLLIQAVDVSFDSLPIPFLEEGDLCKVQSDAYAGAFYLNQMTIPLTADGVSSIGYLKRVTPKHKLTKGKRPKKKKTKKKARK